ncbi:MAG: hypothetical protein ACLFRB_03635 [Thiohalorhabdus sp.]|uniref:hypothetical protein n=1 Tax=Thiohalorhabdus sp. TaxID=3094134 RepID=UPI00397FA1D2
MLARLLTAAALLLPPAGPVLAWMCHSPLDGERSHDMYINGSKAGKIQQEDGKGWSAYCMAGNRFVREDGEKFYGEDFSEAAQAFCDQCEEP